MKTKQAILSELQNNDKELRRIVKWSVKKGIEGAGLQFCDYLRQDSYHEAIYKLLKQVEQEQGIYITGLKIWIINNKPYPLKAYLCKLARNCYYDLLRKESRAPVIDLDNPETQSYIEQDCYKTAQGKQNSLADAEFRLLLKLSYTEQDRTLVTMFLEGYNQKQIAGELQIKQPAVSKRLKKIAHSIASA